MNEKVVMYLGGGAMMGVFGAGVVSRLEEVEFYDRIKSIYSGSAGAFNTAFFLARQTKVGVKTYTEHLARGMLGLNKIPVWLFQRLTHRFLGNGYNGSTRQLMDIDYVMDVVLHKQKLNWANIKKQNIEWYVKLLNVETGELEYVNALDYEAEPILRAAASLPPYYIGDVKLNGSKYVDGAVVESGGLRYLLEHHPKDKIVFVLNNRLRGWKYIMKQFFEGTLTQQIYRSKMFSRYLKGVSSIMDDKKLYYSDDRILVIAPPRSDPTRSYTTDKSRLLNTYNLGRESAQKIVDFLN